MERCVPKHTNTEFFFFFSETSNNPSMDLKGKPHQWSPNFFVWSYGHNMFGLLLNRLTKKYFQYELGGSTVKIILEPGSQK